MIVSRHSLWGISVIGILFVSACGENPKIEHREIVNVVLSQGAHAPRKGGNLDTVERYRSNLSEQKKGPCVDRNLSPRPNVEGERRRCMEAFAAAPIPKGFEQLDRPPARGELDELLEGEDIAGYRISEDFQESCAAITKPVISADRAVVSVTSMWRFNYWLRKVQGRWVVNSVTTDSCHP